MQVLPKPQAIEKTLINQDEVLKQFVTRFKKMVKLYVDKSQKPFNIDAQNEEVIKFLCLYFANHKDFETPAACFKTVPSLRKGIYLCGNVGSGKTLLMKLLNQALVNFRFRIAYCDEITDGVRKVGVNSLDPYRVAFRQDKNPNDIMFDDFGLDAKAKYYGDAINPMYDLIIKRHRLFTENGILTLFTSNLTLQEISEQYDERTVSRIMEMCNVIVLGGRADAADRRKNLIK